MFASLHSRFDVRRATRISIAPIFAAIALLGCDDMPAPADGGPPAWVYPRFAPSADPIDFGEVPWPDDLYLDEDGRVAVGHLPSEEAAIPDDYPDGLRRGLADLDGFSPVAPIFFYFPADSLDPSSLPETPADSLLEDASVFLVDADPASPDAYRRVPVTVRWNAELGQLALRPWTGHPLTPGRQYAAVVTDRVRDQRGMPIGPDPRFAAIRDAAMRPSDPIAAEAYDRYTPVLAGLPGTSGLARDAVAGLAVFTVQTVAPDMADARALVWARDPAPVAQLERAVQAGDALDALLGVPEVDEPGLDVPGGVQHRHIGWLVHGSFESPWLVSDRVGVHGAFRRDDAGALIASRADRVPFTLTLPTGDLDRVPIVIFQHGLGGERSAMMSVADQLAAGGVGVLAIDIPFHGLRADSTRPDVRHNFGATDGPDGFGDVTGDAIYLEFLGVAETEGDLPPFHPAYPRDVLRQSAVDLMGAVRLLREGDWGAVRAVAGLEALAFSPDPLGFVGVSLGGIVGVVFVASEPEVGAAALVVTGGDLTRLVERSAVFSDLFLPILLPKVGVDPAELDPVAYPASFHPEVAIVQTLLDRGDSMSFAPLLAGQPKNLLFMMAEHDEVMPNSATEALARASGAPIVGRDPEHTDLMRVEAPLSQNVEVGARRITRGLYVFAPATHGLLTDRESEQRFAHPPEPPFEAIDPTPVANPVAAAVSQLVYFHESWRGGAAEIIAPAP